MLDGDPGDPGTGLRRKGIFSALQAVQPVQPAAGLPLAAKQMQNSGPKLVDRINDDSPSRNLDASTADLESRVATTAAPQYRPVAQAVTQDDPTAQLQSQYDKLGQPPKPPSLLAKIALAAGAPFGSLQGYVGARNRQQEQNTVQRDKLMTEMQAWKRMQQSEQMQSERERTAQQAQSERERAAQQSQERLFAQQRDQAQPEHMDTDQGPLQYNRQTQQWEPIMVGGQRVGPKAQPKPDTPEQQALDYYTSQGMSLPEALRQYAKDSQKPEQPQRDPQQLAIGPDGKVFALRPGVNVPKGTQTLAGEMKISQGEGGAENAQKYAVDYVQNGVYKDDQGNPVFTGAGDEALMEKFFELAKPSSGFRMTQQQTDMLRKARSWQGSLSAQARHATTGTWFSNAQRKEIGATIGQLARDRGVPIGQGGAAQGGGQPPQGATHTAMGSDGKRHYTNAQGQDLGVAP